MNIELGKMLPGELLRAILLRSQEFQGRAGGRASAQREGEGRAARHEVLLRSAGELRARDLGLEGSMPKLTLISQPDDQTL